MLNEARHMALPRPSVHSWATARPHRGMVFSSGSDEVREVLQGWDSLLEVGSGRGGGLRSGPTWPGCWCLRPAVGGGGVWSWLSIVTSGAWGPWISSPSLFPTPSWSEQTHPALMLIPFAMNLNFSDPSLGQPISTVPSVSINKKFF